MRLQLGLAMAMMVSASMPAFAAETTTYTYDALGRLVTVARQDGPANGVSSTYAYDAANNRTNVTVQGAQTKVVVVPLNGFTVIPLNVD